MRVSFVSSRGSIYLRDAMTAEWKEKELWLSPRRAHYAFPVLFIHPSVLCQPLTWKRKAIQRSNLEQKWPTSAVSGRAILMSKGPELKVKVTGNVKIIFGAYICEKYINSCKLRPGWLSLHAARFVRYSAAAKMRSFRDNRRCDTRAELAGRQLWSHIVSAGGDYTCSLSVH